MRCTTCALENSAGLKLCSGCGSPLPLGCPSCGAELPSGFRFCGQCGAALAAGGAPPRRSPGDGERRRITVLFCDLVGSTALSERLDPEELREVVHAYQETAGAVVVHFGGHIAQYLGDGLLVYFGYPQAHEDDARRAVHTGLGILAAMAELKGWLGDRDIRLAVRLGVHTGPVVAGPVGLTGTEENLALGSTPNIAARLQSLAEPGSLLVSADTYRLVEPFFDFEPLGAKRLKGISRRVPVYRAVSARDSGSPAEPSPERLRGHLVGREREFSLLADRLARAQRGDGQAVLVLGEAGIGKSRLVAELSTRTAAGEAAWLRCQCSPYEQATAFAPLIQGLLQRSFELQPSDPEEERLGRLARGLEALGLPAEALPLLADLLALPAPAAPGLLEYGPQKRRELVLRHFVDLVLAAARERLAVFCMEDLHWSDPSSLEFLDLLLREVPAARLLVILTARPTVAHDWERPGLLRLDLSRLGRGQAEAVIGNVTRGKALPRAVVEELIVKADGVPLFLEELTRTILGSELLEEAAGEYRLKGELSSLEVPDTLRGSLIARLDRLSAVQEVAKLAAVLGRQFTYEMISAVSPFDDVDLDRALELLVQAELLERGGAPSRATYTFRHALLRDAAYDLLLLRTRQQYHRRVADALVERFQDVAEAQPETVAQHYSQAGLAELAAGYWLRAGNRALQRSANLEAVGHLEKGLELLATLPGDPARDQRELELQMALGTALTAVRGYVAPEVERAYFRANELSRQVGDSPGQIWLLQGIRNFYIVRGDLLEAQRLDRRMVEIAEARKDPDLLIAAYGALATSHLFLGSFAEARDCHERALAAAGTADESVRLVGGLDLRVMNRSILSIVLWVLGWPDRALQESRAATALARETGHPFSVAVSLVFGGIELHHFLRDPASVGRHASELVSLCRKHEFPLWQFQGELFAAWAQAHARTAEAGDWSVRQTRALADLAGLGGKLAYPYFLGAAIEAWLLHRNLKTAWPALEEALSLAEDTNERWWNAELYRLQGELILSGSGRRGAPRSTSEREAESAFQQGLDVARGQGARSLELRNAMSLARLWKAQGRPAAARELVEPVYRSFTEGFETRDLRDARALLESCRVAEAAPTTKTRRVPAPGAAEGPPRTTRSARHRGDC